MRERLIHMWQWMHTHRRRWVPPLVILLAFMALHDWTTHAPRELDIELPLGEGHEHVMQVDVAYLESDELVHHVSLRYPTGAPDAVHHQVELAPGRYVVSVDLIREDGATESRHGTFDAPAEGRLYVHLREGT